MKVAEKAHKLAMKTTNFNQCILCVGLALWLVTSVGHAEIYKWVDANGKTHYSENKEDAGKAKAVGVKVVTSQASSKASNESNSSAEYWQAKDNEFKQRQIQKSMSEKTPVATRPKSLSGGRSGETNESRCNLARDIISGAVKHSNGKPTDKYDREVAENDIRSNCR